MGKLQGFSESQVIDRIRFENPWWESGKVDAVFEVMKRRLYFDSFFSLVEAKVRRAIVLMGPRRVGKTVMLFHTIQQLIASGVNPSKICYLSIETPIYNNLRLEYLFSLCRKAIGDISYAGFYIIFDEIQYLRDWEIHLKVMVDSYRESRFIASGSAAAALKLKSNESGAGRFTDFMLPPLMFSEYIYLIGEENLFYLQPEEEESSKRPYYQTNDIIKANNLFIDYINYGGYPEVVYSEEIRDNPGRYIRSDIIDKVLLRDLPGMYGISDVQELNSLFTAIAYNTGNEVSFEGLTQSSNVDKSTIKKYLTYLEAAFLIKIIQRLDNNAKRFSRASLFKIYITNPSLRSALFSPAKRDDEIIGNLVETAIISQWLHVKVPLHYARWKNGEVDIVGLDMRQKPQFAIEVKWTNRFYENPNLLKSMREFCKTNHIINPIITTLDKEGSLELDGLNLKFIPAALYCYTLGKGAIDEKQSKDINWGNMII